jgi:hypothetical protein
MSKFGQKELESKGIESIYIPHSVDTKVFNRREKIAGQSIEDYMGFGNDRFVVGMNAANKSGGIIHRKAFGENLMAFSIFVKKHSDAMLYIHTDPVSPHGWNLMGLGEILGIPKDNMTFVDPVSYRFGISQEDLAGIYSSWDVMLATSYGEGFGIPTVEAQACGVPVIVSDFAASAELVGDGWTVGGQPLYEFNTSSIAPKINNSKAANKAMDMLNVSPNPYYAYSGYEDPGNALDNKVKIINTPKKCIVSIYTQSGFLVRRIPKDDDSKTYIEWDLRNDANVPISSGVYLIHIEAPGIGERIIKWFGVMRPADFDSF